ncbi:NUDIX domain-containing protein [Enterococcus gilvus]|jgi:ADP-ribose pyrophosphatase YjhB (NUDIX family)|uniref:NUDIX hydrolase N-terminal domain-containing protein n=1 Tax=Enterococcus gilvus TaxID=160453 RepID=UPI000DF5F119|nr:NUDIX hydrolase [Enterococcus gilvus]AXG37961.1 NUDIX domain-containing protein [Enterococcus gilvus]
MDEQLLDWAIEIQALAQAGLTYTKDPFDQERFERLRTIATEMLSVQSPIPIPHLRQLFAEEVGYPTPKLDTRAAIFSDNKILLVQEKNGLWSLPGGWVDIDQSIKENTVKETFEETGLTVEPLKITAVQDRNKHNLPRYAYSVCKIFVECRLIGGHFVKNIETTQIDWFSLSSLPSLAEEKNTKKQIEMCFEAHNHDAWDVLFD